MFSASVIARLGEAPVAQRVAARPAGTRRRMRFTISMFSVWQTTVTSPCSRRGGEQIVEVAVVGAVEAEVAAFLALEVHEVLERRDAELLHVAPELLQVQLVRGGEVEAEVDVAARLGVAHLAREHVVVGLVVEEVAEHGGEAALRRVDRLGGVLGDLLGKAEVQVAVDQAGEHVLPLRVDRRLRVRGRARREECGETAVLHGDVETLLRPVGKHHGAVPDDQIEVHASPCENADQPSAAAPAEASSVIAASSTASSTSRPMSTRRERWSSDGHASSRSGGWK